MTQRVSDDQKSRLLLMAQGSPKWDLSQNDCEAIASALQELTELRAQNKWVKVTPETMPQVGEHIVTFDRDMDYLTWTFDPKCSREDLNFLSEKDIERMEITHYFKFSPVMQEAE